jgi:hypothetical protein
MPSQLIYVAATARHLPHPTYVHELQRSAGGVRWPRVKAHLAVRLGSGRRQQPQFKT